MLRTYETSAQALNEAMPIAPQIYARLRSRIVRAELLPGELLSESETARQYGVSRQPVREAFIKLAEGGLVQVRPQRGTMISRISTEAVMDARFVREAIEADVIKAVAERADEAMRSELRRQIAHQKELGHQQSGDFVRLDELFHQTLAEMAGRPNAWRMVEEVKAQMDRVRFLSVKDQHVKRLIQQHDDVVEAVARNDVPGAEAAMRGHLREILNSLPELQRDRPEFFVPAG